MTDWKSGDRPPISAEAQAVLDAAVEWWLEDSQAVVRALADAVSAYAGTIPQRDPLDAILRVWTQYEGTFIPSADVTRAIAAVKRLRAERDGP